MIEERNSDFWEIMYLHPIQTLKYLIDPNVQKNMHHSQNRVESYHFQRAAIAQVGGRKKLSGRTDLAIEICQEKIQSFISRSKRLKQKDKK